MKKTGNNNQNKQNKNQAIKSRKSISPFTSTSLTDPMNSLQNTGLKEKRINMINNFLRFFKYECRFSANLKIYNGKIRSKCKFIRIFNR